jgi:DHA2 family multidrug resistance protein
VGVLGFLFSSLLCSMAWSLESMIVFRAMQGFTGGALIPLAFTLTLIKLPEHHRAKGMAMFAMTATFAPSIGPTLGGWLTENWGWEILLHQHPAGPADDRRADVRPGEEARWNC